MRKPRMTALYLGLCDRFGYLADWGPTREDAEAKAKAIASADHNPYAAYWIQKESHLEGDRWVVVCNTLQAITF